MNLKTSEKLGLILNKIGKEKKWIMKNPTWLKVGGLVEWAAWNEKIPYKVSQICSKNGLYLEGMNGFKYGFYMPFLFKKNNN